MHHSYLCLVAGEAYNIELNLLPLYLHKDITTTRAALRITTSSTFRDPDNLPPPGSELARYVSKIEARAGKSIADLELKRPYFYAPWETLPFAVIVKDELSAPRS